MNYFIKSVFAAASLTLALLAPLAAAAETPQTDVQLVKKMAGKDESATLAALETYYKLHVSELEVQWMREINTGSFLGGKRAEREGRGDDARRLMKRFEETRGELAARRQTNKKLRQTLAKMTGMTFDVDLIMSPDVPDTLAPAPAGAPAPLLKERKSAWAKVQTARAGLKKMRFKLLDVQDAFNKGKRAPIGDAMRAVTKAEAEMARTACAYRLIEAKIAAAAGQSIAAVLAKL